MHLLVLTREACEAIREEYGYERDRREGELKGRSEGVLAGKLFGIIEDNLEDGNTQDHIFAKLQIRYGLWEEECRKYWEEFQKNRISNQ